jgi:hypothetical protein
MGSLLNGLFSRRTAGLVSRSRRRSAVPGRIIEKLESRLAMAINVYAPATASGSAAPWAVIASDDADDVYIQQIAGNTENLFIADNSSFLNVQNISSVNQRITTLYATNGTDTTVTGIAPVNAGSTVTTFDLHRDGVFLGTPLPITANSVNNPLRGSVTYGGNTWSFTTDGFGGRTLAFELSSAGTLSDATLVRPTSGFVVDNAGADAVRISWSAAPLAAPAAGIDAPAVSLSYAVAANSYVGDFARASAGQLPAFSLPVTGTNPGGMVPGTLTGTLTVDGYSISFRMNNLFTPLGGSAADNDLFFGNEGTGAPGTTGAVLVPNGGAGRRITVTGFVNYETGRVVLDFSDVNPGPVSISLANYATFNQDARPSSFTVAPGQNFTREIFADQLTPGSSININSPILQNAFGAGTLGRNGVTLAATNVNVNAQVRSVNYFDVNSDHGVTFLADREAETETATARAIVGTNGEVSAIAVPSGGGGQGYDDDPANAPRVTFTGGGAVIAASGRGVVVNGVVVGWVVDNPGAGYTSLPTAVVDPPAATDAAGSPRLPQLAAAVPERVNFNAAVAADSFSITMGDDPGTDAVARGRLYVSPTGSLSGALSATAAAVTTPASSVRVLADTADVMVEGTIFATSQSYLLQSETTREDLLPFVFTTRSPITGVNTGLVRGTTLAVTLGNDMPTPEQESTAASTVDLRTQITSMRITAATPANAPLAGPYPYDLTISEVDDISFDAVAASSRPITVTAGQSIGFTSALATGDDITLTAGTAFNVSAPLSTSRGRIAISATSVTVSNAVRVLAPETDETRDDIVLTATAGDLSLTGAVTAVNNVRLVQRNRAGVAGRLGGQTRIVGRGVDVEAEGDVDLRTDVVTFEGRAGGSLTLDELDDIAITALRSPGFVTLVAGGTDPGAGSPISPNSIALDATLTDVVGLSVSAPRGSVRVINNVAEFMTLGDPARIAAGTAPSMRAAGDVIIRALATSVTVADAPVGGGSAVPVRVATSAALAGTYAYNVPGTFASTITGARAPLVVDGVAVRAGDRVLVKNQPSGRQRENGVYVVTNAGSTGTAWRLTRAADADTTAELPAGSFIRVTEGTSAGRVFSIAYAAVDNVSPIAVTTVTNRAGATLVRTATTGAIAGTYSAVATTITGFVPGSLPAIDGVLLDVGDLLLVRLGDRTGNAAANGVYEVTSAGSAGSPWVLTRAFDADSGQPLTTGYVATTEGSFRASLTGQAFRLAYNSLGVDALSATVADGGRGTGRPLTSVGSESITSTTTYVVSSTAGTNDAAGSLGKMIALRNNAAAAPGSQNPGEVPSFAFAASLPGLAGAPAGVIRLTQELPVIAKAFAIDGATRVTLPSGGAATPRVVVDGSRITQTKSGTASSLATEVNGFAFAGGGTALRSISNLTVGGFPKGSAVKIDGVPDMLVSGMTLGRNENGERLANQNGVRITGNAVRATVIGSTIVGSTGAGVRVDAGSTGYTLVGNTIGAVNQNNASGVSSAGSGRIGAVPLAASFNAAIGATLTPGGTVIQLPASVPAAAVYAGQSVSGFGIPVGTTIVSAVGSRITLSQAMTGAGATRLTLGQPPRNVIQENLTGVTLTGGATSMINTTVQRSTFDGILISGGSHAIGAAATTTDGRNLITSNGRFGVAVNSPASAGAQSIVNNVFALTGLNLQGNVGVNGAVAPASLGYVPRPIIDSKANEHRTGGTAGSSGNTGASRPTAAARPPSSRPYRAR